MRYMRKKMHQLLTGSTGWDVNTGDVKSPLICDWVLPPAGENAIKPQRTSDSPREVRQVRARDMQAVS